jgi:hypothetical protein
LPPSCHSAIGKGGGDRAHRSRAHPPIALRRRDDPAGKFEVGQRTRPGVEVLQDVGAGVDLAAQVGNRGVDQADVIACGRPSR